MTHEEKPMSRKVKQALHYYVPDADLQKIIHIISVTGLVN